MDKSALPKLRVDRKPALTFKTPKRILDRWDSSIKAKGADSAGGEISIMGEIGDENWGGISAGMIKAALKGIGKAPVTIELNSPGGDAFEGIAIYNLLRDHPGKVTINVLGLAASAASVVAMAGDRIEMGEAAFLMIHSAWGVVMGNRNDMREFADTLDTLDNSVAQLYARRSGLPVADVIAMMEEETWMSAADAVKYGFADIAIADDKKKAKASAQDAVQLIAASAAKAVPALGQERPRLSVVRLQLPGASGQSITPKRPDMKTIKESIAAYEATRAAKAACMEDIINKASEEGVTLDDAQSQEYDTLKSEVEAIDKHLVRLHSQEKINLSKAVVITEEAGTSQDKGTQVRANSGVISVRGNLEPGQKMGRYAMALKRAHGNMNDALSIVQNNKNWMDTSPELAKVFMTAVAAGDTTTAGWASELVYANNLADEFIEFLRPMTILGRIPGLRRVPFNIRIGSQTGGSTGYWVGQGKAIPVSKLTTGSQTFGMTKAAGLVALDEELVRSSSPSAELMVRDDLAKEIQEVMDDAFLNPNNGGEAGVKPASVLYGVTPITPSGTTYAHLAADVKAVTAASMAANVDDSGAVWIMTPATAQSLGMMMTTLGQPQLQGINKSGGVLLGSTVITSNSAVIAGSPQFGSIIAYIIPRDIYLADDGQVTISISNEASIEMLDNPTNLSTGLTAPTTVVSMFQTVSEAIRAVRFVNWGKRRTTAAAYIQAAAYA